MSQFAFFYDGTRCNGCKTCVMACKDLHDLPAGRTYRKVVEYEKTSGWTTDAEGLFVPGAMYAYFTSVACNHCDNPACVAACPVGACQKDADTGIVSIDESVCIGCGSCIAVCPYGAPVRNEDTGVTEKCDACRDRIEAGSAPFCVEACPQRALTFGDASQVPDGFERAHTAPLPDPATTMPNVYVKPFKAAVDFASADGVVANGEELR
jgi:anaerobic dimethyl sulfoxide reductase subunit B (iron-sulfur subunit)